MSQISITNRLFTIRQANVRYLVIPKCACTFVKNVLWRLEHSSGYSTPLRIHDADEKFLRVSDLGLTIEDIAKEDFAFTVIRNPVDRFFSLYTDKVIGEGHKNYVPLRAVLTTKYGLNIKPVTIEDHTRNCEILVSWIQRNLTDEIDLQKDAHWTPQSYRKNIIKSCRLKLLLVNDLKRHMKLLLHPIAPNISDLMQEVEENKSRRSFPKGAVLTTELRKKINSVYGEDRKLFLYTRDAWEKIETSHLTYKHIPRYPDKL